MTQFSVIRAGAVGVAGLAISLVCQGTAAAAPDVAGKTYTDAKQTLSEAGVTPIVATRVGDRVGEDNCIVERFEDANFTNGTGTPASNTVYVYLNCYANVASNVAPGYSLASPQGRAAKSAQEQAAAEQQTQSEASVTAQNQH